jgi:hypothetical protein
MVWCERVGWAFAAVRETAKAIERAMVLAT